VSQSGHLQTFGVAHCQRARRRRPVG
jgi:hypothetical protein